MATACITGQSLWGVCDPNGDPFGTDNTYVLHCQAGEWVPIMTVHEYVAIRQGNQVTIAPVPTKPVPPTTAAPAPTAAPTAAPTTAAPTTAVPTTAVPTTIPAPAPVVQYVIEGGLFVTGGTATITGTNLTTTNVVVKRDGVAVPVSDLSLVSGSLIVKIPAGTAGDTVVVTVEVQGAEVASGTLTYVARPEVTSAPTEVRAGVGFTIVGEFEDLGDTPVVNFSTDEDNYPATVVVDPNDSRILTVTAPANIPLGEYAVTVNTWGGTSEFVTIWVVED